MPLTEFHGPYADLLYEYVSFRQALGFVVPPSTRRTLHHIADYLYTLVFFPSFTSGPILRSRACPHKNRIPKRSIV